MKSKITDKEIENTIILINTAVDSYLKDDEVFSFECPVCKSDVFASLAMFDGSLHGVIECKNCDTYIHI